MWFTAKGLRIFKQESLYEIRGEIADVILADPVLNEAELFEVAALRDGFLPKIAKEFLKVTVQRFSELPAESATSVPASAKAEVILFDFREPVPSVQQPIAQRPFRGPVAKKFEISDDVIMELAIFRRFAVEQEKRVDEQGQVADEGNIECTVILHKRGRNLENIGEVDVHAGLGVSHFISAGQRWPKVSMPPPFQPNGND